jgi:hypothetical protein
MKGKTFVVAEMKIHGANGRVVVAHYIVGLVKAE